MKNFNDYAEKAINRYGLVGNNALARELNINKSSISQMVAGKIYPSETTMIKLAELAGLPKEEALIDLNLWRSKDKPELQKIWQRLSKMIGCITLFSVLATFNVMACILNKNITGENTFLQPEDILCDKVIEDKTPSFEI